MVFSDRTEAGRKLSDALGKYKNIDNVIVLGLPRGGIPVAREVARTLHFAMDVFVVRKLAAPFNEEFAIGAVAQDGGIYIDKDTIRMFGIADDMIKKLADKKFREIEQRIKKFRGDIPYPELKGKTVILVDDGAATGATMKASIKVLRTKMIKKLVVAIPVAPPSTIMELSEMADEVICLYRDEGFMAVGQYYDDFRQVEDDEVVEILKDFRKSK